jgi:hypothetical protein
MPELRKQKWPSYEEFWQMTEPRVFRIHYPFYSQAKRFKRWLKVKTTYFDSNKEKTIDQILDDLYGKVDNYTDYDLKREKIKQVPAIYHYTADYFMSPTDKKVIKHEPIGNIYFFKLVMPKAILYGEGEIFDYDEHLKVEAQKELERNVSTNK